MAETKLVALGDILGFGSLVLNGRVDDLMDGYMEFFGRSLRHAIERRGWPAESTSIEDLKAEARVGLEWFSDSVLLYALDDTDDACTNVAETAAWLTFQTVITPVRLRFGVDYGEVVINKHKGIMVGAPLVIADRLQKAQKWAGGAFTNRAIRRLSNTRAMEFIIDYEVPVKTPEYATRAALNWTYGIHMGLHFRWSRTSDEPPADFVEKNPDIAEKWRNTRAFHANVCRYCSGAHGGG
jgi:hypothetical protein